MLVELIKAVTDKAKSDTVFAQKIRECGSFEKRLDFLIASGFALSGKELASLREKRVSDEELELISGGSVDGSNGGKCLYCDSENGRLCLSCPLQGHGW